MNQTNNYQAILDINVICCLTSFKDCKNCIENCLCNKRLSTRNGIMVRELMCIFEV